MKTLSTVLLVGSLLLNGVFAWFVFVGDTGAQKASLAVAASGAHEATAGKKVAAPIDPNTWTGLDSKDLSEHLARLRDAGFPIEVIRAILSAQISESFAERRKALDPDGMNRPFWKNRPPDPKYDVALQQTYREQQKIMKDLLGKDAEPEESLNYVLNGRRLEGLPPEKAAMVKEIYREFDDKRSDMYAAGAYMYDREKMQALDKAQHAAIARLLTPQELEEFDLRNSNTASNLRYNLTAFDTTEAEFRALYKLQAPFDERFNDMYSAGPADQNLMRQRAEAQKVLTEQIKSALGPERYAQYEKATDYSYRQTSQLVNRLELPAGTTDQVYAVQKEIQKRLEPLYNREVSVDDRNRQLAVLNEEATSRVTAIIGTRGFDAYKQYGGNWMQSLQPRPAPNAAARGGGGGGAVIRLGP